MSLEWLNDIFKVLTTWGVTALGGIFLIVAGVAVARLVRKLLHSALKTSPLNEQLAGLIASMAYYFTMAVILIAAFGVMGVETASLITILGTCSLALGLALQGSLSNFASGMMLFIFRPFKEGDFITVGDYMGQVAVVGLFSTELNNLQNVHVVVPNTYIAQRPIENWSANGACRLDLMIEVAISSDLPAIKQSIADSLAKDPRVLQDPAPFIGVETFGDTSSRLVIRPWCATAAYWTIKYELPETLKSAVEAAGGAMPTPRRDLVIRRASST